MTGQMLALPVGPEGREIAALRAWPRAGGTWAAIEQAIAAELAEVAADASFDDMVVQLDGVPWFVTLASTPPPGELWLAPLGSSRRAWIRARVTVSVEVLDGIP